ncbi:MAG: hypothetical protein ABI165_19400 [Bryobacteraceae bacterium]
MRLPLRIVALAGVALLLGGCEDLSFASMDQYQQDFHFSYPLAAGGKVEVENMNGSIDISGWEKDSVEIDGTKYARSKDALDATKIDIVPAADSIRIRTLPPSGFHGNMGARYTIRVPRRALLDRIVSSNGSIHVDDVQGNASLRTSNGSIRTERLRGDLDARTSNGKIEAGDTGGSCYLHTSNGSITADAAKGSFEAGTNNGSIHVRLTAADADHPVTLETSNGAIDVTMEAARAVRASTSNSSITLHVAPAVNAHLKARTSNSSIHSDFDIAAHGGSASKHRLEGDLGTGGPLIDLTTSNGSIRIVKF